MKSTVFTLATAATFAAGAAVAGTLDDVKAAGKLKCGVSQGLPGFSNPDDAGNWTGMDVDMCRAVAAAVLGDADAVEYVSLSAKDRFTALSSGEIDILSRNTTWTITRDTDLGISFAGVNYYDGQGMMVPASLGVTTA
jgi:general L-amino acid transport system substrate-binding protein